MTDHDVDVNQLDVEFSSIPMPKSDKGYYNCTDPNFASDLNDNCFQFSNITLLDLGELFRSIQSNATGYDEIHPKFLKIIPHYFVNSYD